ncbi:hypothetical protein D3C73_1464400 [compost metagenome]
MLPATIVHVECSILIFKYKLIYRLRTIDNVIDQRFAKQICIRSFRFVRYSHTNSADFALMDIVCTKE